MWQHWHNNDQTLNGGFFTINVLTGCGIGNHLLLIAPLLKDCLASTKIDPEVKLSVFTALSTVLLKRRENFGHCEMDQLEAFLKVVINGMFSRFLRFGDER